ncbi:hypothetical protein OESDEN_00969 [Oesophagostomum dentatum]|uniref:Uncharacterized protein n=1 Tax=Oesophagostomum dentatum TaxID=61180 RepID=A0A0B1TP51_OESDE|nr:hypothetical protein OESDEN_00969 [Oesophagostomum dentatum]
MSPESWPLKTIDLVKEPLSDVTSTDLVAVTINEVSTDSKENEEREPLTDLSRYSCLNTVLRVTSIVGKIAKNWALKTSKKLSKPITTRDILKYDSDSEVTSSDIELSEQIFVKQEQRNSMLSVVQKRFANMKAFSDGNDIILRIIRHESLLQNAQLPYDTKNPIFIPENSELVQLIVQKIHAENAHRTYTCTGASKILASQSKQSIQKIHQELHDLQKISRTTITCSKHITFAQGQEMSTLLARIEAILNTRPLTKINDEAKGWTSSEKWMQAVMQKKELELVVIMDTNRKMCLGACEIDVECVGTYGTVFIDGTGAVNPKECADCAERARGLGRRIEKV